MAAHSDSSSSVLSEPGASPGWPTTLRTTAACHPADTRPSPTPGEDRCQIEEHRLWTFLPYNLLCDAGQPLLRSGPQCPHLTVDRERVTYDLQSVAISTLYQCCIMSKYGWWYWTQWRKESKGLDLGGGVHYTEEGFYFLTVSHSHH